MDAEELQQTVLNPAKRTLKRITIQDALEAEQTLEITMGQDTTKRRKFIEDNAYLVLND
jgi:DNA gyrase subunit B